VAGVQRSGNKKAVEMVLYYQLSVVVIPRAAVLRSRFLGQGSVSVCNGYYFKQANGLCRFNE
jgi:hypothetical protein